MDGEMISINRVMARAFINTMQFALIVDNSDAINGNPMDLMRCRLHSDAQLSLLYSLAGLVNDRNEVMAEYDRMLEMLRSRGPAGPSVQAMVEARGELINLLNTMKSH